MTLFECPVCFHLQLVDGECHLCGRTRGLVIVPTPQEIRDRAAVIRMGWSDEQEESHRASAYQTRRWEPLEVPGDRGGRVNRKAKGGGG